MRDKYPISVISLSYSGGPLVNNGNELLIACHGPLIYAEIKETNH